MPEDKPKFCMRCGKQAVRADSATEEIWHCPSQHGVIYRAPLLIVPEEVEVLEEEPEEEEHPKPAKAAAPRPRHAPPAPPPPKKKKKAR